MTRWLVQEVDSGEVHILPIDDLTSHDDDTCVCGPTTDGWLVTHHSLDGREASE